jgi:prepilin-type processing-associated H-X9-DG protein
MPTFKLLGTDQKEYGPVSADQIQAWIAQGRANARTQLQAVGTTEWKPLAEFQEFAAALQQPGGAAVAPAAASQIQPAAAPPKTSRLAVTSLVLGCLGVLTCGITSLVGLVLGIIALVRINKSKGQLGGQGLALAGTIVSAAFLLLAPIPAALLLPALAKAKQRATGIQCMNNVKQLNLGLMMYANDNKDVFPPGTAWCDALKPYVGGSTSVFVCPQGPPNRRCHYAVNARLAGHSIKEIQAPAQTVLVFEIDGGWNVSGGHELLPVNVRHGGAFVVGFADGHVEMVRPARLEQLHWEP